jgi:hypothetical protein
MRLRTDQRFERLRELQKKIGAEWPSITKAIRNTEGDLSELEHLLLPSDGRPLAENVSLVFFGSLARGESTSQSDLDWTLLINGEVDGQHFTIHQSVRKKLRAAGKIGPGQPEPLAGWPSATIWFTASVARTIRTRISP